MPQEAAGSTEEDANRAVEVEDEPRAKPFADVDDSQPDIGAPDGEPAAVENAEAVAEGVTPGDEREEELERLRQQWLRLQADFDNFRRRTRQEREELQAFATRRLLGDLLPVVDNLDRALLAFQTGDGQADTLHAGVEMVHRQLLSLLENYDVTPMTTVGEPFDPAVHEAVLQEPADDDRPPGVVAEELQKGYRIGDRVLRPAMVKVTV